MKSHLRIAIDARLIAQTGVGRYIRNLIRELGPLDTKNEYIVLVRSSDADDVVLPNFRWKKKITDIPWHSITEQVTLPFIYSSLGVDVVHIPYFTAPIFYPGKFVLTIHDLTILHISTGKATTLPYWFYKIRRAGYRIVLYMGIKRATRILTVSEATKKDIMNNFQNASGKIIVAYEGVDTYLWETTFTKPDIGKPYFLYVGNAYPHKNLEFLIDAFGDFVKNEPNIKLVFVGKEDFFYAKLKEYASSLGVSDSVIFLGHAGDRILAGLYSHATALVFPSVAEGFGLPALEGLAFGCPLLVSDIPVFREILPDDTMFLDPDNKQQWVQAFKQTVVKRKTVTMNKPFQGVVDYLKKFSWKELARQTMAAYEDSAGIRQN